MTDCPKCADVRDHLAAEHILRVQIEKERVETARQAARLLDEVERLRDVNEALLFACREVLRDLDYGCAEVVGQTVEALETAVAKASAREALANTEKQ